MIPQAPSIIVNCDRTHSNLLQVVCEPDGLFLFFLNQPDATTEPVMVGEGERIDFESNPEARDIVTVTNFTTFWNPDMLWSIATLNEDHAVTPLGHYALHNDACWEESNLPAAINGSDEAVAV